MRPRKSHSESGGEGAGMMRWLLTYADLITLLMAFFVIMYAMSRVSTERYALLAKSLRIAFNSPPAMIKVGDTPPTDIRPQQSPLSQPLQSLYQEVSSLIKKDQLSGTVGISRNQSGGVTISILQKVLFDLGSADIRPEAEPILAQVGQLLNQLPNTVQVQGYTDDLPIHNGVFASNWELSAARAVNVVHFLQGEGVAPERLSAVAYGQYHPFVQNTSEANREVNRRVQLVVLRGGAGP